MKPYPTPPDGLLVETDGPALRLRLDRPDRRNAITDDIVLALIETIEAAGSDESVRVITLSGTGDHFCSGFDLGHAARAAPSHGPGRPSASCAGTSTG